MISFTYCVSRYKDKTALSVFVSLHISHPDTATIARKNMEKTGVAPKVKILVGDAQTILKDVKGPFDYIFNDIDKAGYPAVLDPVIERLRVGGLLVTDNVLWGGDVARKD